MKGELCPQWHLEVPEVGEIFQSGDHVAITQDQQAGGCEFCRVFFTVKVRRAKVQCKVLSGAAAPGTRVVPSDWGCPGHTAGGEQGCRHPAVGPNYCVASKFHFGNGRR